MRKHQELFRVGLIGTGKISDIYLQNCARWSGLSIDVCGSLNLSESEEKAAKYGVPRVAHPDDCLLYTSPSPRDLSTSRMPSSA